MQCPLMTRCGTRAVSLPDESDLPAERTNNANWSDWSCCPASMALVGRAIFHCGRGVRAEHGIRSDFVPSPLNLSSPMMVKTWLAVLGVKARRDPEGI